MDHALLARRTDTPEEVRRVIQVGGRRSTVAEPSIGTDGRQRVGVGSHTVEPRGAQGPPEHRHRTLAARGVRHHLRQQGVVLGSNDRSRIDSRVHTDPGASWQRAVDEMRIGEREGSDRARGGQPAGGGVLGHQTGLDRVTARREFLLGERKHLPRRHRELQLHQVDAPHRLGDRMLHLQAGVHLEERDGAVGPDQVLHGARAPVGDAAGQCHRPVPERPPHLLGDARRGGLLEDLLVPTLDRAVPLPEVHHVAVCVAEHLHLDVAPVFDERFHEHGAVPECRLGLTGRRSDDVGELGSVVHGAHAPAPAAGCSLDHGGQWQLVEQLGGHRSRVDHHRLGGGHARGDGRLLGGHLVAQQFDLFRCGADPDEPCVLHRTGERSVLREEPVARVHRVGPARHGGLDHGIRAQVRLRR